MRTLPLGVSGLRHRRLLRRAGRPRVRAADAGGAARQRTSSAILDWADGDNAAWRCHAAFECTEACPSNVRPAQRIMQLRRALHEPQRRRLGEPARRATTSTTSGPRATRAARSCASRRDRPHGSTSAKRGTGHLAFSLNRITGLGLVFYLYLHLAVLSMLLGARTRVARLPAPRDDAAVPGARRPADLRAAVPRAERPARRARRHRRRARPAEGAVLVAHGVRGDPVARRGAAHRGERLTWPP